MPRYDVYRMREGELVVDCQADLHRHLNTRFVVPALDNDGTYPIKPGLNPVLNCGERDLVLLTEQASTVSVRELTEIVGSLDAHGERITRSLDFLMGGY